MGDKYSPQRGNQGDPEGSFGENPGYPSRKRPSDWGAAKDVDGPRPDPGAPPTSKPAG
jgi:hypothetical protein